MKNKIFLMIAIVGFAATITSCKKDKEDPTITIETPAQHSEHAWGAEVHIKANFSDDRALKSYVVMVGDEAGTHDNMFDFMRAGDISGLSHDFHDHFVVPNNAAAMRWVHFTVTDEEGKVSTKKWMLHFVE